jgi:hypothetical protein
VAADNPGALAVALRRFGVEPGEPPTRLESRSGAGVHAVRTSGGDAAYLKLTRPHSDRTRSPPRAGSCVSTGNWRLGRPGTDLAFLTVRATPAGATASPDLIAAYLTHRNVDRRALQLALLAEELAVYLFQWPPFAAYNTPAGVERVRRRAARLMTRWFREADR